MKMRFGRSSSWAALVQHQAGGAHHEGTTGTSSSHAGHGKRDSEVVVQLGSLTTASPHARTQQET